MALLNFAKTYAEVADKLLLPEADSGDYVKLYFTRDGHIISHGKDYTAVFSQGVNGLVPGSTGNPKEVLRGDGQWLVISTTDLPIATSVADAIQNNTASTTILNTQQIIEYVGNSFAANDAMRFKGTIAYTDEGYQVTTSEGTSLGFPNTCTIGDTYRVSTSGIYAGQTCEVGDLLICIQDGEGNSLNSASYWTIIQTNINGQVKHSVNGVSIYTYSSSTNTFNIFAPTTGGNQRQVLISNGNSAPVWVNQNTLTAGVANRLAHDLSVGNGLSFGTTGVVFDGSADRTISLLPATSTTIGGVIVDRDNTNKTISVTSSGSIYLTAENIINALGYVPGNSEETGVYTTVVTNSATSTTTTSSNNPFINLVQTRSNSKTVIGSYQLLGQGHTTIANNNSVITVSSTWRDITVGGATIGDKILNFIPSGDIYLKTDSDGDNIQDISFGLSWYNISTGNYEIA